MRFVELDLFGVYVAPIAVLLVIAYGGLLAVRWGLNRLGWTRRVWHPGLFEFAVYLIILSGLVLAVASFGSHA